MTEAIINDLSRRMDGALHAFHNEMKGIRTGRASASLLDNITVDAYGSKMPLNQLATVNVPEARLITVQVWDQSMIQAVEKAITVADLGLNPAPEGNLIRVPLPDLSEERRKELVKIAGQYAEKAKIAIRNVRRDGMDHIKKSQKDGDISEDEQKHLGDEIQKITDNHVKKIDEVLSVKEKDILEV